ncbi:hypothetical protein Tco_1112490 [Tanacetum coccineum]|uniref:Uncharacterized protein n=1 Tax=Tanacetum coccineum TaxID=301880 RepID=A0ABQ5IPL6_9ASTR
MSCGEAVGSDDGTCLGETLRLSSVKNTDGHVYIDPYAHPNSSPGVLDVSPNSTSLASSFQDHYILLGIIFLFLWRRSCAGLFDSICIIYIDDWVTIPTAFAELVSGVVTARRLFLVKHCVEQDRIARQVITHNTSLLETDSTELLQVDSSEHSRCSPMR